jgi:hypothetical protein
VKQKFVPDDSDAFIAEFDAIPHFFLARTPAVVPGYQGLELLQSFGAILNNIVELFLPSLPSTVQY